MLAYTNSVTTQHSQVLLQNGIHSANYLSPGGGGGVDIAHYSEIANQSD